MILNATGNGKVNIQKFHAVLVAADWVGDIPPYTQTITIDGLTTIQGVIPDFPVCDASNIQSVKVATGDVTYAEREGNTITFKCITDKPDVDIPIIVLMYV